MAPLTKEVLPPRLAPCDPRELSMADLSARGTVVQAFWVVAIVIAVAHIVLRLLIEAVQP